MGHRDGSLAWGELKVGEAAAAELEKNPNI
jgi:hypothetical protein